MMHSTKLATKISSRTIRKRRPNHPRLRIVVAILVPIFVAPIIVPIIVPIIGGFNHNNFTLTRASETIIDLHTEATIFITRETDALERPAGFTLDDDCAVAYAYYMYGRFHSATSAQSAVTFTSYWEAK